ncbi:MAG: serine protease [Pseudomonadota bacterium]
MRGGAKWVAILAVILGLSWIAKDRILFVENNGGYGDSTGTAFPIGQDLWMTARHVIARCARIGVGDAPPTTARDHWLFRLAQTVYVDPEADVAILRARIDAPAHPLADTPPAAGERGLAFGFPQGRPAVVQAEMRGVRRAQGAGDFVLTDRTSEWRVEAVSRSDIRSLDGISGGPVLNAAGEVVGVAMASRRDGRAFNATSQAAMTAAAARAGLSLTSRPASRLSEGDPTRLTRPVVCEAPG